MNRSILSALLGLSALVAAPTPASAGVVFTSQAAFNAALISSFMVDNWTGDGNYSGSGYAWNVGSSTGYYPTDPNGVDASGNQTSGNAYSSANGPDTILFNAFTGGVNAFGGFLFNMDYGSNVLANTSVTLRITGADPLSNTVITTPANGTVPFFGYIGVGNITSVSVISSSNWFTAADRIVAGVGRVDVPANNVPEPTSFALAALALAGGGIVTRRRKPVLATPAA